jgi:hypothetical protein
LTSQVKFARFFPGIFPSGERKLVPFYFSVVLLGFKTVMERYRVNIKEIIFYRVDSMISRVNTTHVTFALKSWERIFKTHSSCQDLYSPFQNFNLPSSVTDKIVQILLIIRSTIAPVTNGQGE